MGCQQAGGGMEREKWRYSPLSGIEWASLGPNRKSFLYKKNFHLTKSGIIDHSRI